MSMRRLWGKVGYWVVRGVREEVRLRDTRGMMTLLVGFSLMIRW